MMGWSYTLAVERRMLRPRQITSTSSGMLAGESAVVWSDFLLDRADIHSLSPFPASSPLLLIEKAQDNMLTPLLLLCFQVGRLWTSLADYYIRLSLFERARDVYEEGLGSVTTVRDFGLVFDALTHFEESLLAAKLAYDEDDDDEQVGCCGARV